jgi:restriction system protein
MGRNKINKDLPTYDQLMVPVLKALLDLGGSATIEELNERVYELTKIPDDILQIPHTDNDSRSEIEYRLAWTRTYLKKYGLLDNSERGVWSITESDVNLNNISVEDIVRSVKEKDKEDREEKQPKLDSKEILTFEEQEQEENWKLKLLKILFKISPDTFERLAQRMLRESGFVQVEVTGRSGDGGIDGKGIIKVGGLLSFHIIFQCKRYKGSINPSQIRDFRGAMQGRADKGLFITTGTFTREAIKEATRDGAPPIDLIDGELLCDKLKELKLGIKTKQIEIVDIIEDWFDKL